MSLAKMDPEDRSHHSIRAIMSTSALGPFLEPEEVFLVWFPQVLLSCLAELRRNLMRPVVNSGLWSDPAIQSVLLGVCLCL